MSRTEQSRQQKYINMDIDIIDNDIVDKNVDNLRCDDFYFHMLQPKTTTRNNCSS